MRIINHRWTYRTLLGVIVLLSSLPELYAQQNPQKERPAGADSVFVFTYRPQVRMFETKLGNNRQMFEGLAASLQTFRKGIDTLYVEGYAGDCGNERTNRGTAFWRCINLKGYLINTQQMRECDFKTFNYPYTHDRLGEVVLLSLSPFGVSTVKTAGEKEEAAITVIEEYKPKEAAQVVSEGTPVIADTQPVTEKETEQVATELPAMNNGITTTWQSERYVAVKTNLAAWAGTIMNVAADVQVGKHVSIELPVLWCPWYVSDRHAVRTFTIQPEARYWLSKPGKGHFFGLHAHVSWFNVKWNDNRYQDTDRPMLGAGISYGYLLPLSSHWGAEFTLGAGYANMKYDTYYNIENGVRFDTQTKNYWGITRAGISLVYRFNAAK